MRFLVRSSTKACFAFLWTDGGEKLLHVMTYHDYYCVDYHDYYCVDYHDYYCVDFLS